MDRILFVWIQSSHEMLASTFQRMQQAGCNALPVTHDGQLVGLITLENVGELMMINSALSRSVGS